MWKKELVQTNRGTFEIFFKGEGEPICITHLYSQFNEKGYYFADPFTEQFKVYLVNLKNAGNSSKVTSDEELSMLESVKDIESIRVALGYKTWAFGGHSAGGMLALEYAIHFPNSLTKIISGGATASKDYMNHEESIYCRKNPHNKRLKELLSIIKTSEIRQERVVAYREWMEMSLYKPQHFDHYFSKPSSGSVVQKRLDYYSYEELPSYDIREELKNVKVHAIVYCGKHDAQCPFVFSEEIHKLLQHSSFYCFHESNHNPFLEEAEAFEEMVQAFKKLR
ncbi:alpha/beta fold hydrolase [Oceanobacillus manasiensis]|uniref:alpha/beta fold hydrolase n=1 Tax=Oceanobacillus manasiensis TaxID=586413 RepID=UPI0005A8D51C|nr:alpha/beta fold hydrolase [Oceanobacillus manasiensis]